MAITVVLPLYLFNYRITLPDRWHWIYYFGFGLKFGLSVIIMNIGINEYNHMVGEFHDIYENTWYPFLMKSKLFMILYASVAGFSFIAWRFFVRKWSFIKENLVSTLGFFLLGIMASLLILAFLNVSIDITQIEKGRYCIDPNDEPFEMHYFSIGSDGIEEAKMEIDCRPPIILNITELGIDFAVNGTIDIDGTTVNDGELLIVDM